MSFLPTSNNNKLPCVLILDGSSSMNIEIADKFKRIDALNAGVEVFRNDLQEDLTTKKSVDVSIIRIAHSNPEVITNWTLAENLKAPTIKAEGTTPMAEALTKAIDMCEQRKQHYLAEGTDYYRPWITIISDGQPTNNRTDWDKAVALAKKTTETKKALIISVAIDGCPTEKLNQISSQPAMELSSHRFKEFFLWLSGSLTATSNSTDGMEQFKAMDDLYS